MTSNKPVKRAAIALAISAAAALVFTTAVLKVDAQSQNTSTGSEHKPDPESIQTFYLANTADLSDLNDIQTSLRNMIPRAKTYSVSAQHAITVRGTPEDLDAAQKLIAALDRPRRVYRLTYTITDSDSGKRSGSQKFVVLAAAGQRSNFKQGSRVPIVTGMMENTDPSHQNSQVQYMDVGLMIDATVTGAPDAIGLHSKIEQTSPIDENTAMSARDPKFRQIVLDENFQLVQGRPLVLASFDIPGTSRHQEIEAVAELLH